MGVVHCTRSIRCFFFGLGWTLIMLGGCQTAAGPSSILRTPTPSPLISQALPSLPPPTVQPSETSVPFSFEPETYPAITIPTVLPRQTQTADRPAFAWLSGIPCQPPCLAGITPGQTSITDALDLLNQYFAIEQFELYPQYNLHEQQGWVKWDIVDGGSTRGAIAFDLHPPSVVLEMAMFFTEPLILKDVIAHYGEPTHISARRYSDPHDLMNTAKDNYQVLFIYADMGFYVWAENSATKPQLSPDMRLYGRIDVFSPLHQTLETLFSWAPPVPWRGFQDFDVYGQ